MAFLPARKASPAIAAVVLGVACGQAPRAPVDAHGSGDRPSGPAAAEEVAAGPLRIESAELLRISRDVVEVRIALVNEAAEPVDLRGRLAQRDEDGAAASGIVLVDLAAQKKSFVLRDARDQPLCSAGLTPIAPGERRTVWARFPTPSSPTVVVVLPGQAPLGPVAVPRAASP